MKKYIVHLYREMRLDYAGIEAATPEDAAAMVRARPTADADNVEDCDGENLSALVDEAGDGDFSQSVTIDFEGERQRKAAPKLLEALERAEFLMRRVIQGDHRALENLPSAAEQARDALADAKAAGIAPPAAKSPARFDFTHEIEENPDRAFVLVDGKVDVAIIRTAEGIVIEVYPKDWVDPIDTMTVWDEEIAAASVEAESEEAEEA